MIVYVITAGIYSDYHISGVALEKEKAEQIVKMLKRESKGTFMYDQAQIEEYDTDVLETALRGGKSWLVWYKPNGVLGAELYGDNYIDYLDYNRVSQNGFRKCYEVCVIALNEDHAKKIGKDLIMKYIAEWELDRPENTNW